MSGQDDSYSGVPQHGGWADEKAQQPVIVVQSPGGDDHGVIVSRRSAALMWMGALLGGALIATAFLAFVYMDASADVKDLRVNLATERAALTTAQTQQNALTERARMFEADNRDLARENTEFATRLTPGPRPRPAPRQADPFADPQ